MDSSAATATPSGQNADLDRRGRRFFAKRNATVLSVLAIVVAGTVWASVVNKFDIVQAIVDLPGGVVFFVQNFTPIMDAKAWDAALNRTIPAIMVTVLDAVAAGGVAALFAYLFALLASREAGIATLAPASGVGRTIVSLAALFVTFVVRVLALILRNIPVVAWAFILMVSFKQSEFTGWLALFFKSFGFLTRTFLETIDDINPEPLEALRAVGASRMQQVAHVIVPMSMPQVISWMLYQIDSNIRDSTLVGMLTGTGVGFVFDYFYRSFRYPEAGLVMLFVLLAVVVIEVASNYVRRRII